MRPSPLVLSPVLAVCLLAGTAFAGDLHINLPKRTKFTPVQKLNQEGVRALKKHRYDDARRLFYKAYLLDPDDPFTLNNLGYISELNGDLDRAQRFYDLAAQNSSDATIDRATADDLKGKKVADVAGKAQDTQMAVNRYNVQAMALLQKERAPEADLILEKALQLDPRNPFTLNNLGYTKEKEGELEQALSYYSRASSTNSQEPVVVAINRNWRGKAISDVADENVRKLRKLMAKAENPEERMARLNLEGVSAMNRNDHAAARKYFEQAYKIDPNDAFTLNNMGYLSELDGDRETADFYYAKAAEAKRRNAKVTVATRRDVEGRPVGEVANIGDNAIATRMETERQERAREGGPILLRRRDNTPVVEPDRPPEPPPEQPANSSPGGVMPPLPDNQQPEEAQPAQQPSQQPANEPAANPGKVMPPLPDNQQPTQPPSGQQQPSNGQQPSQEPANQPAANPGNVLPPLPDNQQPTVSQPPSGQQLPPNGQQPSQQPANPSAGQTQNPPPSNQSQPGDVLQPLPDTQQPPAAKQPNTQNPPPKPPPK